MRGLAMISSSLSSSWMLSSAVLVVLFIQKLFPSTLEAAVVEVWQPRDCDRQTFIELNGCNYTAWRQHRQTCNNIRQLLRLKHNASSAELARHSNAEPAKMDHGCVEDEMLTSHQAAKYLANIRSSISSNPGSSHPSEYASGSRSGSDLSRNPSGAARSKRSAIRRQVVDSSTRRRRSKRRVESSEGLQQESERWKRRKRKTRMRRFMVADDGTNRWPDQLVGYKLDGAAGPDNIAIIMSAVEAWQNGTCLTFYHFATNDVVVAPSIMFTYTTSSTCSSYIGMVTDLIPQPIYLGYPCYSLGVVAHEIGHALGLIHEHQRADRNDYVTILSGNVLVPDMFYQFAASSLESGYFPYDYGSDMHYPSTAYSINGENTILTNNPLYQSTIGQRSEISFWDMRDVNMAYCSGVCHGIHLAQPCSNHGYQDPNQCEVCRCPDGWGGSFCDTVRSPVNAVCGGLLTAGETSLRSFSPGYSLTINPSYEINQQCSWLIQSSNGGSVMLTFTGPFGVYCSTSEPLCIDWVEVRYGTDLGLTGPRFCCYQVPVQPIISEGSSILVIFKSFNSGAPTTSMRGFSFSYQEVSGSIVSADAATLPETATQTKTTTGSTLKTSSTPDSTASTTSFTTSTTTSTTISISRSPATTTTTTIYTPSTWQSPTTATTTTTPTPMTSPTTTTSTATINTKLTSTSTLPAPVAAVAGLQSADDGGCISTVSNCTPSCGGCGTHVVITMCPDASSGPSAPYVTSANFTEACNLGTTAPACQYNIFYWLPLFFAQWLPYCCTGYNRVSDMCIRITK